MICWRNFVLCFGQYWYLVRLNEFHKYIEYDSPGERSPEWLLLTLTDVSTTCAVVIFRVKVSCITSVDGIKLWLLI